VLFGKVWITEVDLFCEVDYTMSISNNIRFMEKNKKLRYSWTKETIRKVMTSWETKSYAQVAKELDIPVYAVYSLVLKLRKAGVKITTKRHNGELNHLINEIIAEDKLV